MAYCNVYYLAHKMFVKVGVPIKQFVFSNEKMAAILIPNNLNDSFETTFDASLEFLKFRETSQITEDFVFKIEKFYIITEPDDINTGLNLWNSIEKSMINFMDNISLATNQLNQRMSDLDTTQKNPFDIDSISMMSLYQNIFKQIVYTVLNSTTAYKEAFNFLEQFNPALNMNNKDVSKHL